MATGSPVHHVAGGDRAVPTSPCVYGAPRPMRTVIDWNADEARPVSALRWPCRSCRAKFERGDLVDDMCVDCRQTAESRFTDPGPVAAGEDEPNPRREVKPGRRLHGQKKAASVDYNPRVVRQWAKENGVDCPTLGRYLKKTVVDAWREATGGVS